MVKSRKGRYGNNRRRQQRLFSTNSRGNNNILQQMQRIGVLLAVVLLYRWGLSSDKSDAVDALQSGVFGIGRRAHFLKPRRTRSTRSRLLYKETSGEADNDDGSPRRMPEEEKSTTTSTSTITLESTADLSSLQAQAAKLRQEAAALQLALQKEKANKIVMETEKVDRWIEELLIEAKVDENTELLKTVDQVWERLKDDRYSAEQVNKIFKRLCELRQQESRSNQSPLMSLLVDAACKLDCMEREDNPNKRWNHKVERGLQKKLFARDWNIELDDEDEAGNPWKLR